MKIKFQRKEIIDAISPLMCAVSGKSTLTAAEGILMEAKAPDTPKAWCAISLGRDDKSNMPLCDKTVNAKNNSQANVMYTNRVRTIKKTIVVTKYVQPINPRIPHHFGAKTAPFFPS